jgi:hypothetical protein
MWETLVTGLLGLLGHFRELHTESTELRDLALSAIISAANETKIYIQRVHRTGQRNQDTEEKLSRLWAAASVPLRHFDRDLANRCLDKSEYWLNPDNYTATDIAKFRIGIDQIYREAKALL